MRLPTLAGLAIVLWLSYGMTLWPLPSRQTSEFVIRFKQMIANPPPWTKPEWKTRSQSDQEESQRIYEDAIRNAQDLIDRANELEAQLWMEWGGRAFLLSVALLGWFWQIKSWRMWQAIVVVTTAILVLGQIFSDWVVYSDLAQSWATGFSGVKYMPWSMVLPMLYLLFVLPAMLLALTIVALRRESAQEVMAK